jgi:hypothetical protein
MYFTLCRMIIVDRKLKVSLIKFILNVPKNIIQTENDLPCFYGFPARNKETNQI